MPNKETIGPGLCPFSVVYLYFVAWKRGPCMVKIYSKYFLNKNIWLWWICPTFTLNKYVKNIQNIVFICFQIDLNDSSEINPIKQKKKASDGISSPIIKYRLHLVFSYLRKKSPRKYDEIDFSLYLILYVLYNVIAIEKYGNKWWCHN